MKGTIRLGLAALSLLALLGADAALAEITPVASASRCTDPAETCAAPLAIFFSARQTTCTTAECDDQPFANEAFHALTYEWHFGDSGAGTWATSGQDKNVEYGPIAIHVFDEPGSYTIDLTVRSDGESASVKPFTIYVDDPEEVWSGTTRCISNDGDFTGCPAGATRIANESSFNGSLQAALSAGDRRILYHAGHTFTLSSTPGIPMDGPGLVGSFGTGKAKIDGRGCGTCDVINTSGSPDQVEDWRFVDLEIVQPMSSNHWDANIFYNDAGNAFDHTLFYRLKRMSGASAFVSLRAAQYFPRGPVGTFVVESELAGEHPSGNSGYGIYMSVQQGGFVGNVIGKEANAAQHNYRVDGVWQDMVIAHNELKCCSVFDASVRGDDAGVAQFMVARGNIVRPGSSTHGWSFWPCCPTGPGSNSRIRDVIIENNRIEWNSVPIVVKTATVRNNLLLNSTIEMTTNHGCGLPGDWVDDIDIYNNSGYGSSGLVTIRDAGGCPAVLPDSHRVHNNLHWNPYSGPQVYGGGLAGGSASANLDRDDLSATPFAADPPGLDPADWHLVGPGAGPAIGGGDPTLASRIDFEHSLRTDGAIDIGALESDGTPPPEPPPAAIEPPTLLDEL